MRIGKFSYDGSLKPMFVLNIILVVVILGAFGIAHTWLGMRMKEKSKEVNRLQEVVQRTQNEIRRLEVDVGQRTNNGILISRMDALGVNLKLIKPGVDEIVTLTEGATK